MSIESTLFDALKTLVSHRVYPSNFPQEPVAPTWPAIRYFFVDTVPGATICGSGSDAAADVRVQIDLFESEAHGYESLRTLRAAVIVAMEALGPTWVRDAERDIAFDPQTKTRGVSFDYLFSPSDTA